MKWYLERIPMPHVMASLGFVIKTNGKCDVKTWADWKRCYMRWSRDFPACSEVFRFPVVTIRSVKAISESNVLPSNEVNLSGLHRQICPYLAQYAKYVQSHRNEHGSSSPRLWHSLIFLMEKRPIRLGGEKLQPFATKKGKLHHSSLKLLGLRW
jgi:hypothetical protein